MSCAPIIFRVVTLDLFSFIYLIIYFNFLVEIFHPVFYFLLIGLGFMFMKSLLIVFGSTML